MTLPRPVIDPDAPTPAQTYLVDRAPDGAMCTARRHDPPVPADVISTWAPDCPWCMACWRSAAEVLNRNGHTLNYTNAAIALWERPGIG